MIIDLAFPMPPFTYMCHTPKNVTHPKTILKSRRFFFIGLFSPSRICFAHFDIEIFARKSHRYDSTSHAFHASGNLRKVMSICLPTWSKGVHTILSKIRLDGGQRPRHLHEWYFFVSLRIMSFKETGIEVIKAILS